MQAEYVRRLGLAGAFIWSLDMDDFSGACGSGRYPLLSAVARTLRPPDTDTPSRHSETDTPSQFTGSAVRQALSYDYLISRQVSADFRCTDRRPLIKPEFLTNPT